MSVVKQLTVMCTIYGPGGDHCKRLFVVTGSGNDHKKAEKSCWQSVLAESKKHGAVTYRARQMYFEVIEPEVPQEQAG